MDQYLLTLVAVRVMEVWLSGLGFQPTGYFDPNDSACLRDYGPHRVWTIQANIPAGIATDRHDLLDQLHHYLDKQADLPGAIRFHAYNIDFYHSPYCGNYVFVSIYHTA